MKSRILESLALAVLTAFATWLGSLAVELATGPDGSIETGAALTLNKRAYSTIRIVNRGQAPSRAALFVLPADVSVDEAVFSAPVEFASTKAPGSATQMLSIAHVPPRSSVTILVPIGDLRPPSAIIPTNASAIGMDVVVSVRPIASLTSRS